MTTPLQKQPLAQACKEAKGPIEFDGGLVIEVDRNGSRRETGDRGLEHEAGPEDLVGLAGTAIGCIRTRRAAQREGTDDVANMPRMGTASDAEHTTHVASPASSTTTTSIPTSRDIALGNVAIPRSVRRQFPDPPVVTPPEPSATSRWRT